MARRRRNFNLANWLALAGILGLIASFALPWISAPRTARIESRADTVAEHILDAAIELEPDDLVAPWFAETLAARVAALLDRDQIPETSFLVRDGAWRKFGDALLFQGKHYEYLLTPGALETFDRRLGLSPALEVYAYPASALSTAQSAFFHSEVEESSYSRNLQADYKGGQSRPRRGAGAPRESRRPGPGFYRGRDDERWIVTRR